MELPMIDWLAVTLDIVDYEKSAVEILQALEDLRQQAVDLRAKHLHDKVLYTIGEQTFEVLPNGAYGYAYILRNELLDLKLAKFRSHGKDNYPLFVHFSSELLWMLGPENAWYWFIDWVERYIGYIENTKLNRVDLCCHTDSISFDIEDLDRFKGRYRVEGLHRQDKEFTGFELGSRGSGTISARIYDKSKEVIKKQDKLWFHEIWKQHDMDINNVWNIEFELHREIFKQFKIETVEDLLGSLKKLWTYLTSEWLVMVDGDSTRIERCSTTSEWVNIQNAFSSYQGEGQITRTKQIETTEETLLLPAMGYLTSYLALKNIKDLEYGISTLLSDGMKAYGKKGKDVYKVIEDKRKLYGLGA